MMDLSQALQTVQQVTGIEIPFQITATEGPGLTVDWDGGEKATVQAEDATALHRGVFLLARAIRENRKALHVKETRHFAHCGAMLDFSRNGVMTVEGVKKWIDHQAVLGLNLLMLYTEDTYTVPGYPYFGYLRGRYSEAELKEMDAYAAERGVEMIPCIQTLGHMKQFLQWPSSWELRDMPDILLIDEEKTYQFLDAAIGALASAFRSRRIHIGMDEAHGVGLGRYLLKHGYTDRFELLTRHLNRVVDICHKYGFQPMMWSDMFFRLGSKNNEYYDLDNHVPDRVIASLPPVEQVYWDYYHTDEKTYDRMMAEHSRMGRAVYAGGVWTWSGFLPNRERSLQTMMPALRVAARRDTDTVFATLWGDDGAETDYLMAVDRFTLFSEACWTGEGFDPEECELAAECLTRMPRKLRAVWDRFYADDWTESTGKIMIWCDPLYPCGVDDGKKEIMERAAAAALAELDAFPEWAERTDIHYTKCVFAVVKGKTALTRHLRAAYEKKDREALLKICREEIPAVRQAYGELMAAHRALWELNRKRQGWEVLALRYGGAIGRLEDVADEVSRYAEGALPSIQELDDAALPDGKPYFHYDMVSTPSAKT